MPGASLPELLGAFKEFLAASGFYVGHGELDFVEDEPSVKSPDTGAEL